MKTVELIQYTKKLKLLYVEDNEDSRKTTSLLLQEFFPNIVVAVDGEDGFEKFSTIKDIDIVITDINMPKLNGIEMISKIREVDNDIYIIVLSAYNESNYFIDSIKYGVDSYILKPLDIEQIVSALNQVIKKHCLKEDALKNLSLLKQYQNVVDKGSIVAKTDKDGVINYVNDEFCSLFEYSREELIGQPHSIVQSGGTSSELYKDLWNTIKNKKQLWQGIFKNHSKTSKTYYIKSTIQPILDMEGEIIEFISLSDDITDIMNPKKQYIDTVKSLNKPQVMYFKIEDYALLREFYSSDIVDIIDDEVFRNIKFFKDVNDFQVKLYQLGNGEYAFVLEKEESEERIASYVKNLQDYIKFKKLRMSNIEYDTSLIAVVVCDDDNVLESMKVGMHTLLKDKKKFVLANGFAKLEADRVEQNIRTIDMIKGAIATENVVSFFQPIVDNQTKEIIKYESLVRIIDKDGKVITPYFFLDIAKKGKYYYQITSIVLENSFKALMKTDKEISINMSILDIEKEITIRRLFELLEVHKKDAHRVVLELLEDEEVHDFTKVKQFIKDVKAYGIKIAIDDFGSGYSNFERLLDYEPDIIKIDGSLVKNIVKDKLSRNIVETIVAFAKKQNMKIIAEFVENEETYELVRDLGVDYTQGYYFAKPTAELIYEI